MKSKSNTARNTVFFYLNGRRVVVEGEKAGWMLADYLRYDRQLTGTKIVCAEGDCGACTVLRFFPGAGQKPDFYIPINSCITTVAQMDCSSLLTVEYLGGEKLDPVQKAMVQCHASQCGFCTPGFVMALKGLVEAGKDSITEKRAKNALTGNLCRCTGYKQILDAALALPQQHQPLKEVSWHGEMEKDLSSASKKALEIKTENYHFFAPTSLKAATQFLSKNKSSRILAAGTDLGVAVNKGKISFHQCLSLHLISELYAVKRTKNRLRVGARVTLEGLRRSLEDTLPNFATFLDIFASPQIKNVATLVGNVCNASPIGDTLPILLALDASVIIAGKSTRTVSLDKFFLDYRKTVLKPGELVTAIEFDIPTQDETVHFHKSSQRKDLDISAVNGALRLGKNKTRFALGGVAAIPLRIKSVEEFLEKNELKEEKIGTSIELLQKAIKPLSDARGTSAFRRILAGNFLKQSLLAEIQGGAN